MGKIDHEYISLITCPYCGWKDRDSREAGGAGDMECGKCGKTFHFERDVTVTYSTDKIDSFKDDKKKSEEIRLERIMDIVKKGGKPTLTGYHFTQDQFDELVPYVKDSEFLNVLKSRVLRK